MKKRLSLVSAALLSLFVLTSLASAVAGDYAKGRGTTSDERFSFLAQATGALDRANGSSSVTFTGYDPNITVTGDVTCMVIAGKTASIGGRITGFKPAGAGATIGNPQGFVINAQDNAKPSQGLDGYFIDFQPLVPDPCPPPDTFPNNNVFTGDITIIPGM
jgi:hypothetical protein